MSVRAVRLWHVPGLGRSFVETFLVLVAQMMGASSEDGLGDGRLSSGVYSPRAESHL
jgi:hypothetical protein